MQSLAQPPDPSVTLPRAAVTTVELVRGVSGEEPPVTVVVTPIGDEDYVPLRDRPLAVTGLTDAQYQTLQRWLAQGAPVEHNPVQPSAKEAAQVAEGLAGRRGCPLLASQRNA